MQVTGRLPFTPMLLAGHLNDHWYVCLIFSGTASQGNLEKSSLESCAALAINQTSDWSLAICLLLK